ncbi:DHA2 family efflux MFS transporter permease subunit [Bacillus aerolatus]|uniref:DHA2 family efflux MFS transporter permease subunit n=1 Tax=Bacillus aerolatus TaxID=2653354 RepID=A0A6I1FKH5_9BACI|nr:DHA2 family efflux MFS transporter permease subunit [Bacillus aerolatus]KAB7709120.1 DHA2 family efflux MFS transporter permease subunit [Bacillus aerolatus]
MQQAQKEAGPFWTVIFAVFFGNFLAVLSTTTINVALPVFMKDFSADLSTVQWTVTGFMLAMGAVAPTAGFFGGRLSYKKLYMIALAGFTFFSILCASAWNIESLILFRILQGVFSGAIMPATMTIVYQSIAKDKLAFAISLWSLSAVLAPALGPTAAGVLIDQFSWQAVFLINVPIGLAAIWAVIKFIPAGEMKKDLPFDFLGFVSVIIASASLLIVFSEGYGWGWTSMKTIGLFFLGSVTFVYFIQRELKVKEPLLNFRVLNYSRYTYSLILNSVLSVSLYSGAFLTPVFIQSVQGASALETGLIMLPGSLLMALMTPVVGKVYNAVGPVRLIFTGLLIMGIGTFMMGRLTVDISHGYVAFWMAIRYLGIALCNMPITNAGMTAVPPQDAGYASAINNWIRQGMASFSIGIFAAILAARTAFHELEIKGTGIEAKAAAMSINDVYIVSLFPIILALPLTLLLIKEKKRAET